MFYGKSYKKDCDVEILEDEEFFNKDLINFIENSIYHINWKDIDKKFNDYVNKILNLWDNLENFNSHNVDLDNYKVISLLKSIKSLLENDNKPNKSYLIDKFWKDKYMKYLNNIFESIVTYFKSKWYVEREIYSFLWKYYLEFIESDNS